MNIVVVRIFYIFDVLMIDMGPWGKTSSTYARVAAMTFMQKITLKHFAKHFMKHLMNHCLKHSVIHFLTHLVKVFMKHFLEH